jgi:CDP-diacylglycerol---glycerol-3-phosphate 3-phosphatidyltransferase
MRGDVVDNILALQKLKREWLLAGAVAGVLLVAAARLVQIRLGVEVSWLYAGTAGVLMLYQLFHLWRNMKENFPLHGFHTLYPDFGLANWITLFRAFLLALLAGFLVLPRPSGWFAWAPGLLYSLAAILDYLDGSVARLARRSSHLGEILDMQWDGFGVLVAASLLVLYGQVPGWYLLVGLARYFFVLGIWLRRRRVLAVYELPPNVFRRALAGVQMGFIAVVLLPVFSPPATWIGAGLFALPLLVGFVRDWFYVSGVLDPGRSPGRISRMIRDWGPSLLRGGMVGVLGLILIEQLSSAIPLPGLILVGIPALLAIVFGVAGRFFALVVLIMSVLVLQTGLNDWRFWALMLLGAAVMTFGTGRFSLWKPEEWLIYHRIGESRSPY